MAVRLVNVGFGNVVAASRIIAIVAPDSAPAKRLVQEARERSRLIDASHGRRTRAVVVMDSMYIVRSALQPETLAGRVAAETE